MHTHAHHTKRVLFRRVSTNTSLYLVWGTPPLALNGGSGTDAVSGFVRLAVHTASQSDSSFAKRHEKIMSLVWPDQSDSRFTVGSLSLFVCVCRHITTSAFQIDGSTTASVPDSNFPVERLATRDYSLPTSPFQFAPDGLDLLHRPHHLSLDPHKVRPGFL